MPPTKLYEEGWLLRIIMDWFANNNISGHPLSFDNRCQWYSEALLQSTFFPRPEQKRDPLAESWTHADAVIGNFIIPDKFTSKLELLTSTRRLVVLEAKIYSKLSPGVTNASYYDQAARYIACIAELLHHAAIKPFKVDHLAFHVLAPKSQIEKDVFVNELNKESIRQKVKRRAGEYGEEKGEWFDDWFMPTLDNIEISAISWEEIIASIRGQDNVIGVEIEKFYVKCLKYNEHVKTMRFS